MNTLPIISVAGLASDDPKVRRQVASELGYACREVGFFYVVDHGIPDDAFDQLFADSAVFFAQPLDEKQRLSIKHSPHNRGYIAMQDEKLNPQAGADRKEAFNIGTELAPDHPDLLAGKPFRGVNFWPQLPGWRERMLAYFDQCLALGRLLHRGFSLDLGRGEDFFAPMLEQPIATLRLLYYPAVDSAEESECSRPDAGAGEHTDYGNLTLLKVDGVAGLEVRTRSGEWIDAPVLEGAFVCNIGDCLMRWSNDTYLSTPHRVGVPAQARYSAAFFLEVDPDARVDPRDLFPEQAPKYPPISCADYLASRLNATYEHRVGEGER